LAGLTAKDIVATALSAIGMEGRGAPAKQVLTAG
jgi:hypothetical protein